MRTAPSFASTLFIGLLQALLVAGCSTGCSTSGKKAADTAPSTQTPKQGAKPKMQNATRPVVVIETNKGNIEVELLNDKAPISTENFLKYVDQKHYDGTIFHRVISNFMIQGGGFTPDMKEKSVGKPIKNEADNGVSNRRGTLSMARTMVVDSATAQFYINVKDNNFLDHRDKSPQGYGYAVFGEVKSGMDVVDAIKIVPTASRGMYDDVPVEPVVIKTIRRK